MNYKIGDIIQTDPMFFGFDGEFTDAEIIGHWHGNVWVCKMISTGVEKFLDEDCFL